MSNQQWEQVILKKILDPLRTADDYLQVYSFIFGLCTISVWNQFRPWQLVAVPKLKFLRSRLCCRDTDSNRQNTEHSLEKPFWNFATTPVIVAPVRLPRLLWWLPRLAKQSLYDWCLTWNKCHWSWNVTSAMRTGPTSLQLHSWALHSHHLEPIQTMAAGSCSEAESLCCRDIDPNRQNTEHSLEEQFWNFATMTIPLIDRPLDLPGGVVHPIL